MKTRLLFLLCLTPMLGLAQTQIGEDIVGEDPDDSSGASVSLSADGSIVAIGALGNDGNGEDAGHVRVYQNISGTWTQVGADIDGEAIGDESGGSISLSADGEVVAIGARLNDGNGEDAGHVRVYQNNAGTWTQVGADIDGEAEGDRSSTSISLSADGDVLAIGAPSNEGNGTVSSTGHVRVYQNNAGTWIQIGADIDGAPGSWIGNSVSLSGNGAVLAVGGIFNTGYGYVTVYKNEGGTWTQVGETMYGWESPYSIGWSDYSGWSVSLSEDGGIIAIGTPVFDSPSPGYVSVFDLSAVLYSDHFVQTNFKVYPNPTADFVNVQLSEGLQLERVNVYSASGQLVKTEPNQAFSVNDLAKGTYIIEVITDLGKAGKVVVVE